MPATGETERAPSIAKAAWDAAGTRARAEGLPLTWVTSRALSDYSAGHLALPRTTTDPDYGNRRGRSIFASDAVWTAADKRRAKDGIRSMSALVEILLDAYARNEIHTHARMVTTSQRDALDLTETPAGRTGTTRLPLSAA
ncbi:MULTISPECIES: hypothetical protein [unclassified Streptomyces]|uniref:hypothetical protein n=1 Tax=unclassified Streptomyces TaxID=2593676 RepID=UPI00362DF5D1